MNDLLIHLLLKIYPATWRAEYGPEMELLLRSRPVKASYIRNVAWSGLKERLRHPLTRFLLFLLSGSAVLFVTSSVFAGYIWRAFSRPALTVLSQQDAKPFLIASWPLEQLTVIYLEIPLVFTALASFAWMLVLAWKFFASSGSTQQRRWAKAAVLSSASCLCLTTAFSFSDGQSWCFSKLLALFPDSQNAPFTSVQHCFVLLLLSTLVMTLLPQLPLLAFFNRRLRAGH